MEDREGERSEEADTQPHVPPWLNYQYEAQDQSGQSGPVHPDVEVETSGVGGRFLTV